MPDPFLLAKALAVAALVAALVPLAVRLPKSPKTLEVLAASGAWAVATGLAAGVWALGQMPHLPPREGVDRFFLILLPAALLAEIVATCSLRLGWLLRLVVVCGAAPVLLYLSSYVTDLAGPGSREWSPGQALTVFAGLAIGLCLDWLWMVRLVQRAAPISVVLSLALACCGAALTIMLSGYATGGQLGIPLAAALAGASVAARSPPRGAIGVGLVGLFGLLVIGRFSAGLTTLNAALLLTAPLYGWLAEWWTIGPKKRGGLRLLLTAIPVGVAVFLAQQKFISDSARPNAKPTEPSIGDYLNFGK